MRHLKQISLLLFCISAFCGQNLFAQVQDHNIHSHEHPVLMAIQNEVDTGELSVEEALLQSIYAGFKPERLDSRFRTNIPDAPHIRCMTPVLMQYEQSKRNLSPSVVAKIEELISVTTSAQTLSHKSPSGNFILYYETEGRHAVPLENMDENDVPDYIDKAAFAADSSYRHEVENIGFMDFLKSDPYEIFIEDLGNTYGYANSSGSTTYIRIHNNFIGFPENTHPEGNQTGALYATIAHEVKHAIQYATNRWKGDAGSRGWSEMDATLMEEIVFDDVNDYYNYIKKTLDGSEPHRLSIFGSPDSPIPKPYNHVTWALYFAEMHGMDFWVDVWDVIRADCLSVDCLRPEFNQEENLIPFLDAVNQVIEVNSTSLPKEHILNHLWHMTAGPDFITPGFGFSEREEYPSSYFHTTLSQPPDSLTNQNLQALAANYIQVLPSNIMPGQPTILLDSEVDGIGIGVIAFFRNGDIDTEFIIDPNSTTQSLQTTWSWDDIIDMRIAVVNTNRENSGTYNLTVTTTIPDEDMITQNYPNPFNPTTNIEFSLRETKDVRVEVYDRIGRKISTLVDDRLNRGFHTVEFDGSAFASGVYFYRIVTDQTAVTKKMVLIK